MRPILFDGTSAPARGHCWSPERKQEHYLADFVLIGKRTLAPLEYDVMRFHLLLGADWKLCCRRLGIKDKGTFFHLVYRVQETLGQAFLETKPYALYPLDGYFARSSPGAVVQPFPARDDSGPRYRPIRPPLAPRKPRVSAAKVAAPAPQVPGPARQRPRAPEFDKQNPLAVAAHIRALIKRGYGFDGIVDQMNRLAVPVPGDGVKWFVSDVKRLLLERVA